MTPTILPPEECIELIPTADSKKILVNPLGTCRIINNQSSVPVQLLCTKNLLLSLISYFCFSLKMSVKLCSLSETHVITTHCSRTLFFQVTLPLSIPP